MHDAETCQSKGCATRRMWRVRKVFKGLTNQEYDALYSYLHRAYNKSDKLAKFAMDNGAYPASIHLYEMSLEFTELMRDVNASQYA